VIPLSDALYILAGTNAAMFALGWWGRRAVGHAEWQEGYAEGTDDERAAKVSAGWEREFSQPDLNDFVDGVLDQPAPERTATLRAVPDPSAVLEGTVGRRDGGGIVVPRLEFPAEPWTILDADPTTSERLATVAEVRADADYWLWRTEMAGLIDGAAQWFDEEFHTGTFRAAGR
jgi:hypothetical protein